VQGAGWHFRPFAGTELTFLLADQEPDPAGDDVEALGDRRVAVGDGDPATRGHIEVGDEHAVPVVARIGEDHRALARHRIGEDLAAPIAGLGGGHRQKVPVRECRIQRQMERKLSVGEALSEVFAIYRENAGVLIPLAFWLFFVVAIVQGLGEDSTLLLLIGAILNLVVSIVYQGMVVSLVRDVQDGRRDLSVGDLYRQVSPVLWTLVGASILYAIAVAIGFVLLIVPGLILLTIWAVIAPAIVIENRGVTESFRRSRELVKDYGWPVFGTVLCAALITVVVGLILLSIAAAIADGPILRIILGLLASSVTAPVGGLVAGVLYYRLLQLKGDPGAIAKDVAGEDYTPPPPPPVDPPSGPVAPA